MSSAPAADIVGKWTGKAVIDQKKLPEPKTRQEILNLEGALKDFKSSVIQINLNSDKTFRELYSKPSEVKEGPQFEGHWALSGSTLILTTEKYKGKTLSSPAKAAYYLTKGKREFAIQTTVRGVKLVFRPI